MIVLKAGPRGLILGEFEDRYGQKCSIQESSLATDSAIWLGVDVDLNGKEVAARMHLTRAQVKDLIPVLRYFARNGSLGHEHPKEVFRVGQWVIGVGETNRGIEGRVVEVSVGQHLTVQDNSKVAPEGEIICLWENALLVWEELERPDAPSRYDRLLQDEDNTV